MQKLKAGSAIKKTTKRKQRTTKTFNDEAINFLDDYVFRLISVCNSDSDEESQQRLRSKLNSLKDEVPKSSASKSSNQVLQLLWADDLFAVYGKSWAKRNITDKGVRDRFLKSLVDQRKVLAELSRCISPSKTVGKI